LIFVLPCITNTNNIYSQLDAYRPATSWAHHATAVTHSLVLLKMGEIIARNMLSWLELLINPYCCIKLVIYIISIRKFKFQ